MGIAKIDGWENGDDNPHHRRDGFRPIDIHANFILHDFILPDITDTLVIRMTSVFIKLTIWGFYAVKDSAFFTKKSEDEVINNARFFINSYKIETFHLISGKFFVNVLQQNFV